jgi:hypothetical protein
MKKKYEDLISIIFKLLGLVFLLVLLSTGFYFVGYLWKLILGL